MTERREEGSREEFRRLGNVALRSLKHAEAALGRLYEEYTRALSTTAEGETERDEEDQAFLDDARWYQTECVRAAAFLRDRLGAYEKDDSENGE